MPAALYPYVVSLGGILGLMGLWLGVQRLWGRTFAVDGDVLASREECGACAHANQCAAADLCAGQIDQHAGVAGLTETLTAASGRGPTPRLHDSTTPRDKAG